MFHKIYLETTNPLSPYSRLISLDILFSIIFHIFLYMLFLYIISNIFKFTLSRKTYTKIIIFLFLIMISGYVGRLWRSKSIYKEYVPMYPDEVAKDKTERIIDNAYITWYFIA